MSDCDDEESPRTPPRMNVALRLLQILQRTEAPLNFSDCSTATGRDLTAQETRAKNAACDLLTTYFRGEAIECERAPARKADVPALSPVAAGETREAK